MYAVVFYHRCFSNEDFPFHNRFGFAKDRLGLQMCDKCLLIYHIGDACFGEVVRDLRCTYFVQFSALDAEKRIEVHDGIFIDLLWQSLIRSGYVQESCENLRQFVSFVEITNVA